jgi:hypothetical protein
MTKFSINCIETPQGTFRISGSSSRKDLSNLALRIENIEMMGTDGWVMLNQSHESIIRLMNEITPKVLAHINNQLTI